MKKHARQLQAGEIQALPPPGVDGAGPAMAPTGAGAAAIADELMSQLRRAHCALVSCCCCFSRRSASLNKDRASNRACCGFCVVVLEGGLVGVGMKSGAIWCCCTSTTFLFLVAGLQLWFNLWVNPRYQPKLGELTVCPASFVRAHSSNSQWRWNI